MPPRKNLVKGKIVQEGEKYFVVTDQTKQELSLEVVPLAKIKLLLGKDVQVEISEPAIRIYGVLGTGTVRPPRVTCYIPVPFDFNPLVAEDIARYEAIVQARARLLEEGAITKEVHAKIFG